MPEITLQDSFGQSICETISRYNYTHNLEIGSWDGSGSTQCFIAGMQQLANPRKLYCLEIIPERYKGLVELSTRFPYLLPINQSSINYESFKAKDFDRDVWNSSHNPIKNYPKELVYSWYVRDIAEMKKYEQGFLNQNEESFDAVLIDGGAFTGYSEYVLLKDRTKCFMLDDAQGDFKCNQAYYELSKSSEWTSIFEAPYLRNGAAIFVKRD